MQYEAKTPEEYLEMLEKDWRFEKLSELRDLIKAKAPDFIEGINYKMLSYGDKKGIVFHLNAQKNYVSLYVGDTKKVDPEGKFLEGIDKGKGCLRFKKSLSIQNTKIDQFIEKTISLWKSGKDVGC